MAKVRLVGVGDVEQLAKFYIALAGVTALRSLDLLLKDDSPMGVTDIANRLSTPTATASDCLRKLSQSHILERKQKGRGVYYRIHPQLDPRLHSLLKEQLAKVAVE